jgi:hypothetical protein
MSTESRFDLKSSSDTNLTATGSSPTTKGSVAETSPRKWSTVQDGPLDPAVDIWWNGKWVPAYYKDIRAGDFFLYLTEELNPDLCYYAHANARTFGTFNGHNNYGINGATEVKQAPAIRDINTKALPHEVLLLNQTKDRP